MLAFNVISNKNIFFLGKVEKLSYWAIDLIVKIANLSGKFQDIKTILLSAATLMTINWRFMRKEPS